MSEDKKTIIEELADDCTFLELVEAAHYNDAHANMTNVSHAASSARNRDTLLAAIALQQGR